MIDLKEMEEERHEMIRGMERTSDSPPRKAEVSNARLCHSGCSQASFP